MTISIGGNDAGFSTVARECGYAEAWFENNCVGSRNSFVARTRRFISHKLPGRLSTVYAAITRRAPRAKVLVVGYPRLFGDQDCNAFTSFSDKERRELNKAGDLLASVTSQAAQRRGFHFVDPRSAFIGHDNCGSLGAWMNGLSRSGSFHPNAEGHKAYARLVLAKLGYM